jgi:hypothetical protein
MAVQFTGYNENSAKRYLLDAGAIYKNLTYNATTGEFTGTLLGATSGGNQFQLSQEKRTIEVDGLKGAGKGNTVIVSEEPILTCNLKELTAQNLALAIAGANVDTEGTHHDIITSNGKIELSDYLDNVAFVGRLSGSEKPVVIVIENAISMEGIDMSMQDNQEAVVPIQFKGHYDAANISSGNAPFKIYWPKEVA